MLKAKQKIYSILLVCLAMLATLFLGVSSLFSAPQVTASAATTEIVFNLGANGTASHNDGSSKTSYSETVDGYTLSITNVSGFYTGARDAKGNSCIKLGAKSSAGSFNFTVPDDVTSVVIAVAKYKTNATKIKVNNTSYTISNASNNGTYDEITVDTSSTKTVSFTTVSGGYRAMVNTITFVIESSEPECTHEGTETTWVYDNATKEHYKQCKACEKEIEGTRELCTDYNDFEYGEYTTENGKHTRTLTCQLCGGEQNESGTCQITAAYEREDNQHTQTGTCDVCHASTSVKEDCTLTVDGYEALDTDDKATQQHAVTTTCSVCEQTATVNEACTFDEGVLDGAELTYTCKYCGYSYTETVATYTVEFVVPNGIEEVESVTVAEGFTTALPEAGTIEGYTFVGWVKAKLDEKTEAAPECWATGEEYTVTEDVDLYALYSYAEGTGAWTKVTDATTLAVGKEIVIVASGSNHALGADKGNNRNAATITKSGDTVTINDDVQIITLEEGKVSGTFAFNVGNGYLYAASSDSNYLKTKTALDDNGSWKIEISSNSGVATIKAQGTYTRNWLRKNSQSALFSCYSSGQNDVSIYMKDCATYYITAFNTCTHTNISEVIEKATCTESGSRTVTCLDCESEIESEILPALGHNYVDGICQNENCGKQDPASIVYDGYYYFSINDKYLSEKDGKYYKLAEFTPGEIVDVNYVVYFVKNGETYDMYHLTKGLFASNINLETQEDYTVHITNSEDKFLSHNTTYSDYIRIGFYSTEGYPRNIVLTEVELPANMDGASLTVKEDIAVNYKVELSEALAEEAVMYFTVNGETYDIKAKDTKKDGERYVFSLDLPPQYMTENIQAVLKYNDLVLDTQENYSIQQYAINKLNAAESSNELKQLVSDMLHYGAAAQTYKNHNVENLANNQEIVANILDASKKTPTSPETPASPINNPEVTSYGAWFTGANVWFDSTNKIMVSINTTENVTLTINGEAVEVTGKTIDTSNILPTEFGKEFVFVLSYDGVVMQTLTYSVNAYAYKMQNHATMGKLALALYNYGVAAEAYAATL